MTNIVPFKGLTKLNIDPDGVLEGAVGLLDQVWVFGVDKDGKDYIASSICSTKDMIVMLETVKFKILRGDFDFG